MHWRKWINQRSPFISLIALGVFLRLLAALFLTHTFDFLNILALAKSVADTGNLLDGFFATGPLQLYGKIYYQLIAGWLYLLNTIHLIDLRYLFDVKAYEQGSYMRQFPTLGPEIYQIAAIKLIQLVYDFLLLYFLVNIVKTLRLGGTLPIILFWAINPFIIYVGYVIFQSDLAMITFLTGGSYFLLRGINSRPFRVSLLYSSLSVAFFAIGGVIKQVPLLAAPIALLLSRSIRQFAICAIVFMSVYILFYQPWASDAPLIRAFFLTSTESRALFDFKLNGLTIFFVLYLSLLALTISLKQRIVEKPIMIIHLLTLLMAIVYISEAPHALFVQFNLWIVPFLAILSLYDKNYCLFFVAPLLGFYQRVLVDQSVLSGTLSAIIGEPIDKAPKYENFLKNFMHPDIIISFVSTLVTMLYILLIIYIVCQLVRGIALPIVRRVNNILKLNLVKVSLCIFLLFVGIAFGEFLFMSRQALLTNYEYSGSKERILSNSPVIFNVSNPHRISLNGVALKIKAKDIAYNDETIITVLEQKSQKVLAIKSVNDYLLPDKDDDYFTIAFPHSVSAEKLQIKIAKKYGRNNIVVYEADKLNATPVTRLSVKYDNYYKNSSLKLSFPNAPVAVNVRGQYTLEDISSNISYHIAKKPTFFLSYFLSLLILGGLSLLSLRKAIAYLRTSANK